MSRQFRSDDTDKWKYGFGDGSDGDLTISSNTTEAPIDSSCSGTSGATSLSATNASFAPGQIVLIHQTRGTGAGNWELNKIASYVAGTITLKHALQNTYTDSGASQAQVRVLKQYNNVTVNSGVTWTAKAWNGDVGGILGFFAKGVVTIDGTVFVKGKGFRGGADRAYQGEGTAGAGSSRVNAANGNGGGGPAADNDGGGGGGHGTAGQQTSGSAAQGGAVVGTAELTTMLFGGGGGGGGDYGTGGAGGGILFVASSSIIGTSGIINDGGNNGNATSWTAGGSGAGGSVLLKAQDIDLTSITTTSTGGPLIPNTSSPSADRSGGAGGTGRIHADYSGSFAGTTSPTINTRLDSTIKAGGSLGNFFAVF